MDPFTAAVNYSPDHLHVVLISTGSVASIKIPLIVKELLQYRNVRLEVVATKSSLNFYNVSSVRQMGVRVWTDEDEWSSWKKIGDPILHIELRRWADLVLIAPCSANTLAKLAGGICDDLSTSLLRALPPILAPSPLTTSLPAIEAPEKPDLSPTQKEPVQGIEKIDIRSAGGDASGEENQPPPTLGGTKGVQVWIFPAMNTFMYQHPLTERHLSTVQDVLKYRVIGPIGTF